MATYRIAVGKRHKVEPRQIVGAIANEGGLSRQDFGHIDILGDHSLVELPADLPGDAWSKLEWHPDLRQADRAGAGARHGLRLVRRRRAEAARQALVRLIN